MARYFLSVLCTHSDQVSSDFVFSPDVKYVAAISEDGCLRVIDALAEQYAHFPSFVTFAPHQVGHRLVDCYASYFGSLTCVAWSPDGRFILACSKCICYKAYTDNFSVDRWPGRSSNHFLALGTAHCCPLSRPFIICIVCGIRRAKV